LSATPHVFVRAGAVRQRVFEQAAIAEAIAQPAFERDELVADRHDARAALVIRMLIAVDQLAGILGMFDRHGDPQLAEIAGRHGENRAAQA
jgi:hypothetical protein